jgi:hypothetical protein
VYRTLLGRLSLLPAHWEALLGRGLDEGAIEDGLYRSLSKTGGAALARELLERFPARLLATVPGFCMREGTRGSYPSFIGARGLLIPVLDLDGFVVALKVRRDDDDPRYLYVSSSGRGGPGPRAPVHVCRWNECAWNESARVVRITEGELKADVAAALSGVLTVSVPVVSAWRSALPVLRTLASGDGGPRLRCGCCDQPPRGEGRAGHSRRPGGRGLGSSRRVLGSLTGQGYR